MHGGSSGHGHTHDHGPGPLGGHSHAPAQFDRAFAVGIGLNTAFVITELYFGWRANSLALTADAGHNVSDVLALILAWVGSVLARRAPSPGRTYGLRRFSILAALANAVLLLAAVVGIVYEGIERLRHPSGVNSTLVITVAFVGIVVNVGTALGFRRGREGDLNVRGAFLHMMGDAAVSAGVVVAGIAIHFTGWLRLDPATSLGLAILIAIGTWGLLRDSVNLALDAVPRGIDEQAVERYLAALPGVIDVHDLHIWGMSTTHVALTAHLVVPDTTSSDALLTRACHDLHEQFNIEHTTLQIEQGTSAYPCGLAPAHVV
jgi:cobalt-zinc-cadmium efflux system protein